MKICTKCNTEKEITKFYKQGNRLRSQCKECSKKDNKQSYIDNKESRLASCKTYREDNKESIKETKRIYAKKNSAKIVAKVKAWRRKNGVPTREEYLKELTKNAIGRAASSLKYAHKRRTQTQEECELTEFIMEEAVALSKSRKECTGIDWHIDHTVPLNGKDVCGLHTYHNLEVVPATWNVQKGNRNTNRYINVTRN